MQSNLGSYKLNSDSEIWDFLFFSFKKSFIMEKLANLTKSSLASIANVHISKFSLTFL